MCISPLESEHIYSAINKSYAGFYLSAALVVLQNDAASSMLRVLQKLLNFSETKLLPASDINLAGMIFTVAMRFSADNPSIVFITRNLL